MVRCRSECVLYGESKSDAFETAQEEEGNGCCKSNAVLGAVIGVGDVRKNLGRNVC